jgi:hypothetical protein
VSIDLGSVKRSVWLCKDATGALVNPSSATATVTVGLDAPVTVPVTLPPATAGTLIADYLTAKPGLHRINWLTAGPVTAGADYFNVRQYISLFGLDEARDYLGYPDGVKDTAIRLLSAAATKLAEQIVGTCVIRSYTGQWINGAARSVLQIPHRPLPAPSAVTKIASVYSAGTAWGPPDLIVNEFAGTCRLASWRDFWYGPWRADYQAGRIEIGENIVNGTKDILWDLFTSQRAMFADTAASPTLEEEALVESVIPAGYALPAHAAEQLEPSRLAAFG